MLGMSGLMGSNSGVSAGKHKDDDQVGVVGLMTGGFGEEERGRSEEDDRNSGGNRWPRQETLALLKIRSDMDVAFRDSTLKGRLWEDVSRKLAELGFHRSAKKCKEKFENMYKYYKRTKEGRAAKQDGKIYRFSDQLEALDNHSLLPSLSQEKLQIPPVSIMAIKNPTNISQTTDFISTSTPSSSSSDEESEGTQKKKRKLKAFFENLMKEVVQKQETLQKEFLEAIEKREHERMVREEAWKMQELARMNREHEILVQERSIAAAKDAAVIAFLQKISEQSNLVQLQENSSSGIVEKIVDNPRSDNFENFIPRSSSRWPKAEVQTLIKLRTCLDLKYQDNGPKGPLWEEISAAMRKHGYNRNAKRCKEKWENINKYFKKVKESNKKRPEDSKTCPYFHQLDALYKEKMKKINNSYSTPGYGLKPEELVMQIMAQPEQQRLPLPLPLRQEQLRPESVMEDLNCENIDQKHEENEEDGEEEEDEDEDEGSGYEIVTHKPCSMAIVESS